jgi:hypothetical protein
MLCWFLWKLLKTISNYFHFSYSIRVTWSRGSSVSIVWLRIGQPGDRGSIPRDIFLEPLCPDLLWGPLSHLYFTLFLPGVLSPMIKCGRGVTLTTHPHLVPRSWMSRSYTSSPPCASVGVLWDCIRVIQLRKFILTGTVACVVKMSVHKY